VVRGLAGIVEKRKDSAYRSGTRGGWLKVKIDRWKAKTKYRAKLFEKPAHSGALKGRAKFIACPLKPISAVNRNYRSESWGG
jgi:hypothetical protein